MSFIEEIQPYIERIELHQKGGNITNIETLRAIRDIHFKYIRHKDFDTPSNLGCGNCVRQMINQLVGEIGREEQAQIKRAKDNTTFKKGSKEPIKTGYKMTFPKIEQDDCRHHIDSIETIGEHRARLSKPKQEPKKVLLFDDSPDYREFLGAMKWGEFKKHCTSKGLKVKGKTREVLENELKGL